MKLVHILVLGSALVLHTGLADAGDARDARHRDGAKAQHGDRGHRNDHRGRDYGKHRADGKKQHRGDHHKPSKRYHVKKKAHRSSSGHQRRTKKHGDHFTSGVLLGGVLHHSFLHGHSFCPDRGHGHHRNYRHGDYIWSDYTEQCYRVKHGRHGDIFKQVPRRRCF